MSAFGGKAAKSKQGAMSAYDPERTSAKLFHGGFSMVRKAS